MFSLLYLTVTIVEKNLLILKKRIRLISIGAAILTTFTSVFTARIQSDLIKREVRHYVKVLRLRQNNDERIEGLHSNFSRVPLDDFVLGRLQRNYYGYSFIPTDVTNDICFCISAGCQARKFVDEFLSEVLSELKQDAITVYIHLLKRDRR